MIKKPTSEALGEFLDFWRYVTATYSSSNETVSQMNEATSDLLHQLELGSAKERSKYATQLARVRRCRREHKDFVDINEALVTALNKPEYVKIYRELEQILGATRKQERYVASKRQYRPRQVTNMSIRLKDTEEGT